MSKRRVSVKNYRKVRHVIATGDPDIDALLPTRCIRESVQLELHGVNNSIVNALRRATMTEVPVHIMTFDLSALHTDNPFILVDMILTRVQLIPIDQSTGTQRRFRLDVTNTTEALRGIYSSEIVALDGGDLPFNGTFELFTLDSGQHCTIDEITIETGYGYMNAAHTVCVHGATVPIGANPYNEFTGEGDSCSVSSPMDWQWQFDTNGTAPPLDIIAAAIDGITARIRSVLAATSHTVANQDMYTITLPNESATVGNLIMRNMQEVYSSIPYVSFVNASIGRSIDIKVRTQDDINVIMASVVKYILDIFADIKAQIVGYGARGAGRSCA